MIGFTILFMGLSFFLGIRLWMHKKQTLELARQLGQMDPDSSLRLTCWLRSREYLELCKEINTCIDRQQEAVLKAKEAEKELKYTISCVSHDIRTPLAGASGYMQLLEKTQKEEKRTEYCRIIRQKLEDLGQLLEELFFYTRLTGEQIPLECRPLQILPVLGDALAGFYQAFLQAGREPRLSFQEEAMEVFADPQQLRRVLRNLISNSLTHGQGPLFIVQENNRLLFKNEVLEPEKLSAEHLFDRFYRGDSSRGGRHAGLGLSISKELMEKMGGTIEAEIEGKELILTVSFSPPDN